MKKILFTICGRAGSKGVAGKNLKTIYGKPMVYYSLSAIDLFVKENPEYDCDIVLNTDSSLGGFGYSQIPGSRCNNQR